MFEEVFIRIGMPYRVVGGVRFYERREVRDALAYLRMLVNPDDEVSLRRILNTPKRGIGDRAVEVRRRRCAQRERITFWEALRRADEAPGPGDPVAQAAIQGFVAHGRGAPVDGRRRGAGRRRSSSRCSRGRATSRSSRPPTTRRTRPAWRTSPSSSPSPASSPTTRWPGPRPTRPTSTPARSRPGWPTSSSGWRWSPTPTRSPTPDDDGGVVTLMTLHTAKGLEFPVVFLTGLEDGVFPHSRSLGDQPELEEERRLAYVGVTRARERLYISRARGPLGLGRALAQPRLALPRRAARSTWSTGGAPRPRRPSWDRPDVSSSYGGLRGTPTAAGRRNFSSAAARADAAAKAKPAREIPSLDAG